MARDAADLHRVAHDLRLTEMQRRFVEALAADPNRNATRAALTVGAGKGAAVTASKWLKLTKVQHYLQAVVAAAVPGALDETNGRVLSLHETLTTLTAQARGEMPTGVRERGIRFPGGGSGTRVTETYDMFRACCNLLTYYEAAGLTRARD